MVVEEEDRHSKRSSLIKTWSRLLTSVKVYHLSDSLLGQAWL